MAGFPQPLPEGDMDYSCPYSCHKVFGLEAQDIQIMKSNDNGPTAMLTDNCVRAVLLNTMQQKGVNKKIALFDPQWLSNWMRSPFHVREQQCWEAFPRPLHTADLDLETIILPFNSHYHWMLIVIELKKHRVLIYDSMQSTFHTQTCTQAVEIFAEVFHPYMGGKGEWKKLFTFSVPDIIQQTDGVSCGIHTILNANVLLEDMGNSPEEMYPSGSQPHDIQAIRQQFGSILDSMY